MVTLFSPYTAITSIRKMPTCLNFDIHVAIYVSYLPFPRLWWVDTPLSRYIQTRIIIRKV